MKLLVKGERPEEPRLLFWLEQHGDIVKLIAGSEESDQNTILEITEGFDGVEIHRRILGRGFEKVFQTDGRGYPTVSDLEF